MADLLQLPGNPKSESHPTYPTPPIPPYGQAGRPLPQDLIPFNPEIPAHAMKCAAFREERLLVPSAPTSSRPATRQEDNFTKQTHAAISMDLLAHPGRELGGEYLVKGDRQGNLIPFTDASGRPTSEVMRYSPGSTVGFNTYEMKGASFMAHSHPPTIRPFASSGSPMDHYMAAKLSDETGMVSYQTDGQNMHEIKSTDMGFERLTPYDAANPPPTAYAPYPPPPRADSIGPGFPPP